MRCIRADNDNVWHNIAEAAVESDKDNKLRRNREQLAKLLPAGMQALRESIRALPQQIEELARVIASNAGYAASDLRDFAGFSIDVGLEVPEVIRSDPRWDRT